MKGYNDNRRRITSAPTSYSTLPPPQDRLAGNTNLVRSASRRRFFHRYGLKKKVSVCLWLCVSLWVISMLLSPPVHNGGNFFFGGTTEFQEKSKLAPECTPLKSEEIYYTLVTQVSTDRLWMVIHHCQRWKGPVSIAAFTDKNAAEIHKVIDVGCEPSQVNLQIIRSDGFEEGEYPVNALRNLALSGVRTSHVVYVDIDFWLSPNLLEVLNLQNVREHLASDDRLATVIPSFQLNSRCDKDSECFKKFRPEYIQKMPRNKAELIELMKSREVAPFDPTNRGGYGSTDYGLWVKQKTAVFRDIPCIESNRYEPYMAFRYCKNFPPFQEIFTGYGKNKMSQVMHMRRIGYIFSQLGGVFVIHFPHLDSKSRKFWNKMPKEFEKTKNNLDNFKRGQVDSIFVKFKRWLVEEIPDITRVDMCSNTLNDDTKLWV
mmetsp:Transcript_9276/g.18931  ORF Transcript_9276/g.18931 Transcript_9276/m.18931 type:complete len:430 (-) Transcript_9276:189-1478(-)